MISFKKHIAYNHKLWVKCLALAISLTISSCAKDKGAENVETNVSNNKEIFLARIQAVITDLNSVLNSATFGYLRGNYPIASKKLLVDRIAYLEETVEKVNNGTRTLNRNDMDNIILLSMQVKDQFLVSALTEDFQAKNAELYVEGKSGGYIDFGSSPDYSSFSDGFTVELWLKFANLGSFDYIFSTFIDNFQDPGRSRFGWAVNYYGEGNDSNIRMTYVLGTAGLYEPGFPISKTSDVNRWMHVAFVWNPSKTSDGSASPNTFKMYIDGVLKKTEHWNETNYSPNLKTNLVGFNFTHFDGVIGPSSRGTNGSMKNVNIWRSVKSETQINAIKNNPNSVIGNESDLVAGWRFDKTAPDVTSIADITGRHVAKVVGKHNWNLL